MATEKHLILTVKEVTILLRIQRPKVYDLIHDGVLEGFKLGSDWRIKTSSVEKLIGPIPQDFFQAHDKAQAEESIAGQDTARGIQSSRASE